MEWKPEVPNPLDPAMPFVGGDPDRWGTPTVLDYWRWGHSNFLENTARGRLAEFIVARALGDPAATANEWESYDVLTPGGLKVEVKSAAYVQNWGPEEHRSRIVFSIRPAQYWNRVTGQFEGERQRHADVYVFALLTERDRNRLNPFDLGQWDFYPIRRADLDARFPAAKTISLTSVSRLSSVVSLAELRHAVERLAT